MRSGAERGERLHRRAWDLLPWYANGTLADGELRVVETHLETCAFCRAELAACRGLSAALSQAPEIAPAPHPAQLARVLARIDRSESDEAKGGWSSSLRRLCGVFAATPAAARWALAAQLALVFGLAGALMERPRPAPPAAASSPAFRTLSTSPDTPAETATSASSMARVRIVFAPGTREQEIRDLLLSVRGQIAGGPSPLGVYTVEVPATPDPLADVLAQLRKHRQVSLAEPVEGEGR